MCCMAMGFIYNGYSGYSVRMILRASSQAPSTFWIRSWNYNFVIYVLWTVSYLVASFLNVLLLWWSYTKHDRDNERKVKGMSNKVAVICPKERGQREIQFLPGLLCHWLQFIVIFRQENVLCFPPGFGITTKSEHVAEVFRNVSCVHILPVNDGSDVIRSSFTSVSSRQPHEIVEPEISVTEEIVHTKWLVRISKNTGEKLSVSVHLLNFWESFLEFWVPGDVELDNVGHVWKGVNEFHRVRELLFPFVGHSHWEQVQFEHLVSDGVNLFQIQRLVVRYAEHSAEVLHYNRSHGLSTLLKDKSRRSISLQGHLPIPGNGNSLVGWVLESAPSCRNRLLCWRTWWDHK